MEFNFWILFELFSELYWTLYYFWTHFSISINFNYYWVVLLIRTIRISGDPYIFTFSCTRTNNCDILDIKIVQISDLRSYWLLWYILMIILWFNACWFSSPYRRTLYIVFTWINDLVIYSNYFGVGFSFLNSVLNRIPQRLWQKIRASLNLWSSGEAKLSDYRK